MRRLVSGALGYSAAPRSCSLATASGVAAWGCVARGSKKGRSGGPIEVPRACAVRARGKPPMVRRAPHTCRVGCTYAPTYAACGARMRQEWRDRAIAFGAART
eukprot:3556493-Prymnesium_polylepis.1